MTAPLRPANALALAATSVDSDTPILANNYLGLVYFPPRGLSSGPGSQPASHGLAGERAALRALRSSVLPAVLSRTYLSLALLRWGAFAEGVAVVEAGAAYCRGGQASRQPCGCLSGSWPSHTSAKGSYIKRYRCSNALRASVRAELLHFSLLAPVLGATYVLCGRVDEAVRLLERAIEQATSSGRMSGQALLALHPG